MGDRRRIFAVSLAVASLLSVAVFAQQRKDDKNDPQTREIQSVVKLADDVSAGQAAPNDFGLNWAHEDFLKAGSNKEYVPFTISLDPSKVPAGTLVFYWRVVSRTQAAAPPPPPPPAAAAKNDKTAAPVKRDFAYEDVTFIPVTTGSAPTRINRSFTVGSGVYDVFVVAKEQTASTQRNAPAPKTSVLKQTITVPDFWTSDLSTSSVIVAQRIDPLPAPLTPQQQVDRPYALGSMEITPALDTKLSKKAELSVFFLIYNPKTDSANKPDISVEYSFCQMSAGGQPKAGEPCKAGEKFFNKTSPQNLNGQTLPAQFDLAAGHQLQTGQAIPLASFPEGEYRLEIKVTDRLANKAVTRDINFTVIPS